MIRTVIDPAENPADFDKECIISEEQKRILDNLPGWEPAADPTVADETPDDFLEKGPAGFNGQQQECDNSVIGDKQNVPAVSRYFAHQDAPEYGSDDDEDNADGDADDEIEDDRSKGLPLELGPDEEEKGGQGQAHASEFPDLSAAHESRSEQAEQPTTAAGLAVSSDHSASYSAFHNFANMSVREEPSTQPFSLEDSAVDGCIDDSEAAETERLMASLLDTPTDHRAVVDTAPEPAEEPPARSRPSDSEAAVAQSSQPNDIMPASMVGVNCEAGRGSQAVADDDQSNQVRPRTAHDRIDSTAQSPGQITTASNMQMEGIVSSRHGENSTQVQDGSGAANPLATLNENDEPGLHPMNTDEEAASSTPADLVTEQIAAIGSSDAIMEAAPAALVPQQSSLTPSPHQGHFVDHRSSDEALLACAGPADTLMCPPAAKSPVHPGSPSPNGAGCSGFRMPSPIRTRALKKNDESIAAQSRPPLSPVARRRSARSPIPSPTAALSRQPPVPSSPLSPVRTKGVALEVSQVPLSNDQENRMRGVIAQACKRHPTTRMEELLQNTVTDALITDDEEFVNQVLQASPRPCKTSETQAEQGGGKSPARRHLLYQSSNVNSGSAVPDATNGAHHANDRIASASPTPAAEGSDSAFQEQCKRNMEKMGGLTDSGDVEWHREWLNLAGIVLPESASKRYRFKRRKV